MTSPTPISPPGATPTPSPAHHICLTPSPTSSPSPATTAAPRRASSVFARRRPLDICESSENRRAIKDASHHRLVPSRQASGCKGARELVDSLPHGWPQDGPSTHGRLSSRARRDGGRFERGQALRASPGVGSTERYGGRVARRPPRASLGAGRGYFGPMFDALPQPRRVCS